MLLFSACSNIVMNNQISLSGNNWKLYEEGKRDTLTAVVPGLVHTDLLRNKIIPEPYYRTNENDLQWIGEKNWIYETYFDVQKEILTRSNIEIFFQGIDTHAKIYLNDKETEDYFRSRMK